MIEYSDSRKSEAEREEKGNADDQREGTRDQFMVDDCAGAEKKRAVLLLCPGMIAAVPAVPKKAALP